MLIDTFRDLYSLVYTMRATESNNVGQAGHVARVGRRENAYSNCVLKTKEKRPRGRPRYR